MEKRLSFPNIIPPPSQVVAATITMGDDGLEIIHQIVKLHPNYAAQLDRIEEKLDLLLKLLESSS